MDTVTSESKLCLSLIYKHINSNFNHFSPRQESRLQVSFFKARDVLVWWGMSDHWLRPSCAANIFHFLFYHHPPNPNCILLLQCSGARAASTAFCSGISMAGGLLEVKGHSSHCPGSHNGDDNLGLHLWNHWHKSVLSHVDGSGPGGGTGCGAYQHWGSWPPPSLIWPSPHPQASP